MEQERILAEYQRRACEVDPDLYAPWNPAQCLMLSERKRVAARMLHRLGVFPHREHLCLEVGVGSLGWLPDLLSWGVPAGNLAGIELNPDRLEAARFSLPSADLHCGDASQMPWDTGRFHLIVCSTVFSSILEQDLRVQVASEMIRVLAPGGAVVWYDLAVNNPRNRNVQRVSKRDLIHYFPEFKINVTSITLAPPIARTVAPVSVSLAVALSAVPILRTHLLAVLQDSRR
jgi:ubiquinone/menaquinone biosynthesis C-methylase UbiE